MHSVGRVLIRTKFYDKFSRGIGYFPGTQYKSKEETKQKCMNGLCHYALLSKQSKKCIFSKLVQKWKKVGGKCGKMPLNLTIIACPCKLLNFSNTDHDLRWREYFAVIYMHL